MRRFAIVYTVLTILIVLILSLIMVGNDAAAAPLLQVTNTPAPTPITQEVIDIDGTNLVLDQSISIGDIGIVIALLLIAGILIPYTIFKVVTHYLR